jgi:hypothetical protein
MSTAFDAREGLIVVPARIWGPSENYLTWLALDTGATTTLISATALRFVGCDPAVVGERVRVTTGSGVEFVARVPIDRIEALGQCRTGFSVLCHTHPVYFLRSIQRVLQSDRIRSGVRAFQAAEASASRLS